MQAARIPIDDLGVFALMAKALALQPLGQDPVEHGERAPRPAAPGALLPRRGLLDRLDHWFWRHEQRAREAYLAESTDIYDLEVRIRALERGVPGAFW